MPKINFKTFIVFIKEYKFTLILSTLLIVCLGCGLPWLNIGCCILNIILVILLLAFSAKIKKPFCYILIGFFVLVMSIDVSFILMFKSPLALGNIASAFETNSEEAAGFMKWERIVIFLFCLTILTFFTLKSSVELSRIKLKKKSLALITFVYVSLFAAINVYIEFKNYPVKYRFQVNFKHQPVGFTYALTGGNMPILYSSLVGTGLYIHEKTEFFMNKYRKKDEPTGLVYNEMTRKPSKIYLVVGESSYRGHYSAYNYPIKTTPFLDSLATNHPENISFYDGISVATITRDAFRFIFSFATPSDPQTFYSQKNIIDLAKERGYETIWISNQYSRGIYDDYPAFIGKSSDQATFLGGVSGDDLNLLKHLEKQHNSTKDQLVVLHMIGSHEYYESYSDHIDEGHFIKNEILENEYRNYDKTIHHTDRFLRTLTEFTCEKDDNSLIFFFSDHGEIPNLGHGLIFGTFEQFEIPFIFIKNNLSVEVDDIAKKYIDSKYNVISNVNVPYIASEIMGYEVADKQVEMAIEDGRTLHLPDTKLYPIEEIIQRRN